MFSFIEAAGLPGAYAEVWCALIYFMFKLDILQKPFYEALAMADQYKIYSLSVQKFNFLHIQETLIS